MNTTSKLRRVCALLLALGLGAIATSTFAADANPPARMTYQGFVVDANGVALGKTKVENFDVIFRIYSAQTGGTALWSEQQTVTIDNGNFSVLLGEGSVVNGEPRPTLDNVFVSETASDRFIGITVKNLGGSDAEISPRLRLLPAPYAFLAKNANSLVGPNGQALLTINNGGIQSIGGSVRGANANDLQTARTDPSQVASGANSVIAGGQNNKAAGINSVLGGGILNTVLGLNSAILGGGENIVTSVGGSIVSGYRNMVTGQDGFIGAGSFNTNNGVGGVIVGGSNNKVTRDFATVGGGTGNIASGIQSVIGGGVDNLASLDHATVGGGNTNKATGIDSTIGGGFRNVASGLTSFVGGGSDGIASGDHSVVVAGAANTASGALASVVSGSVNIASGNFTMIGGGTQNRATGDNAIIGGGLGNTNAGLTAFIGGGFQHLAKGTDSFIGGGYQNKTEGHATVVGGGLQNQATLDHATVAGGHLNKSRGINSFVGGGYNNDATGTEATIGGGNINVASGLRATIAGGVDNKSSGNHAAVGGGHFNWATGVNSVVPGGYDNNADGDFSFATGRRAKARHRGSFVWADTTDSDFSSQDTDEVSFRCRGGFYIITSGTTRTASDRIGVFLNGNDSSWGTLSDKNAKRDFEELDYKTVLQKLDEVPIQKWHYNGDKEGEVKHIGPVAQDFIPKFYPGKDDKVITTLQFDGVELAAIKGLHEIVKEKDAELQNVKNELAELKKAVQEMAHERAARK